MKKEFDGGYYIAILELFQGLDGEYHGKQVFQKFEDKFGSGNYLNFLRALKILVRENKVIKSKPKEFNRRYYKLNKKVKYKRS